MIVAPVSVGELLDKISILRIKEARISGLLGAANVKKELLALEEVAATSIFDDAALSSLQADLRVVNEALWDVEDAIRDHDARGDFGPSFVALAQAVYRTNDRRAAIKRAINELTASALVEEKSYAGGPRDP